MTDPPAMATLTQTYGPIFMIVAFSLFVAGLMYTLASYLGPKNPSAEKDIPYECGSDSVGSQHVKLSVKFYFTAILFVLFDIEAIFLYPWSVLFQRLGMYGLTEMLAFLGVLTVALVYCWKKGALEWQA